LHNVSSVKSLKLLSNFDGQTYQQYQKQQIKINKEHSI